MLPPPLPIKQRDIRLGGAGICEDTDIWLSFRARPRQQSWGGEISCDNTSVEDPLQPYAAF